MTWPTLSSSGCYEAISTSSSTLTDFRTINCTIRQIVKPLQRKILCDRRQITLIATKTRTKINGMPVWMKHDFSSSDLSVSMHSMKVRIDDIMSKVKKNLCTSKPNESRCHTMMPSFLWRMSLTKMTMMKGISASG